MRSNGSRVFIAGIAVLSVAVLIPLHLQAGHNWGKYHWARSSNPLVLSIGDNVSAAWNSHLDDAVADWDSSDVLSLSVDNGTSSPDACLPTLGRVEVCNASYGTTGWLGVAQIWVSKGSHIVQATTKLNDTYFADPYYNTSAWRQYVVCQEVGHTFGLDHQDETFDNPNLGSCMDYTDDPDGTVSQQLSNTQPNRHDYDELDVIYAHLDGISGGGGGGGGRGRAGAPARPDLPDAALINAHAQVIAEWGQLVRSSGRLALYDLDLGNGDHVFTFVILA